MHGGKAGGEPAACRRLRWPQAPPLPRLWGLVCKVVGAALSAGG